MSESIRRLTSDNATESSIKNMAIQEGMTPLLTDAWHKIMSGITTYEEAIRISGVA